MQRFVTAKATSLLRLCKLRLSGGEIPAHHRDTKGTMEEIFGTQELPIVVWRYLSPDYAYSGLSFFGNSSERQGR